MNLTLKSYKLLKTKLIVENNSLIFIFNKYDKDNKEESSILKNNNKSYSIRTKLLKKLLKRSLLGNLSFLINGTIVLTIFKKDNPKTLLSFKTTTSLIGLKLNKKLYSEKQLNNLKTLNYNKTIKNLHGLLNSHLIFNSLKLKKFRNNVI